MFFSSFRSLLNISFIFSICASIVFLPPQVHLQGSVQLKDTLDGSGAQPAMTCMDLGGFDRVRAQAQDLGSHKRPWWWRVGVLKPRTCEARRGLGRGSQAQDSPLEGTLGFGVSGAVPQQTCQGLSWCGRHWSHSPPIPHSFKSPSLSLLIPSP